MKTSIELNHWNHWSHTKYKIVFNIKILFLCERGEQMTEQNTETEQSSVFASDDSSAEDETQHIRNKRQKEY